MNSSPRDAWRFPNRATPLGSSTYYSIRFAPRRLRHDLANLLAWRQQVRAILDEVADPSVARLKLQWWREELQRTYEGQPRHPLSIGLYRVLAKHALPAGPFLQITGQVEEEILRRHPADEAALIVSCERDMGALLDLMTRCHGIDDQDQLRAARTLGVFCRLVYLIRDSGVLARQGRTLLPTNQLHDHGLSVEALTQHNHRARLPELLPGMAQLAHGLFEQSRAHATLPTFARVRAELLEALLLELEKMQFDVAEQRIGLTPLRKLWLAWQESRRRS